jgi:prepilin-type N-terminal cleavage/methylation domain-containing protein
MTAMSKSIRRRGMTLIELCFGLAIVAVIAGLAVPGLQSSLRAAAVRSATFELLAGLQRARGTSILESRALNLCPSDAAGHCVAAGVSSAHWQVASPDGGRAGHALPAGVVVRATRSPLWFSPDALGATTGTLTICDERRVAPPRAIVLSLSGRARLESAPAEACG